MYKCKYFTIKELVSPNTYKAFGNFAWKFFDARFLQDLDTIRIEWEAFIGKDNASLVINNGTTLTQCGYRSNVDPMVKAKTTIYASPHTMCKAVDLHTKRPADTEKLWNLIRDLIIQKKLSVIRRLETKDVTIKQNYVHADAFQTNDDALEVFVP